MREAHGPPRGGTHAAKDAMDDCCLTPRIFLIFFWNRKKRGGEGRQGAGKIKQNKPGFQSKSDGLYFFFFFLNPSEGLSQVQLSGLKRPRGNAYQSILG